MKISYICFLLWYLQCDCKEPFFFFGQKITAIWAFQSNFLSLCIQNNCCWVFYYYYYYCLALWTIRSKCFVEELDLLSFSLGLLVMIWSSWWKCLVYFIISFIGHSSCQVQCLENFVYDKMMKRLWSASSLLNWSMSKFQSNWWVLDRC